MSWQDKIKQLLDNIDSVEAGDEPEFIVVPKESEADLFKILTEMGFEIPEPDEIDKKIEELLTAGKFVIFDDEERVH